MQILGHRVIPAEAGIQLQELFIQIAPLGVHFLNQFNLPYAFPFLDCLLPRNGRLHGLVDFVPDQGMHSVTFRESFDGVIFVLPYTLDQL